MSLLNNIKGSISDTTIKNLSHYLGEDFNGTRLGLDLAINAFLAGIIKFAGSERSAKNLLNILSDGGHTGDIFNNIESFSGNIEKSKLLETIGNNISNHFLTDNSVKIGDQIGEMAGIKKNSSNSLLNFSAPLVLGFLGKTVRENNMNAAELRNFLYNEGEEVSTALPLSVSQLINLPKFTKAKPSPQKHNNAVSELNKDEANKNSNWGLILPWIFLLLVGGLIYYFTSLNSKKKQSVKNEITAVSDTLHPEEFLPLDTLKPVDIESDSTKKITKPEESSLKTPPVIEKKEQPIPSKPDSEKKEPSKSKEKKSEESEKVQNNTPKGLSEISNGAFSKNSAEIVSSSSLQSLLAQIKGTSKKITLTPLKGAGRMGEDRVYAIRDFLLENGVSLSQVEIAATKSGNNASGVAFKISN